MDVLVRILRLQEQQLGHDQVRHVVFHLTDQEDDALLEQARIDVVGALAAGGLLDDDGDQAQGCGLPIGASSGVAHRMDDHL
jgi:hypothetical protein